MTLDNSNLRSCSFIIVARGGIVFLLGVLYKRKPFARCVPLSLVYTHDYES
jgi:hypothetical protein